MISSILLALAWWAALTFGGFKPDDILVYILLCAVGGFAAGTISAELDLP